MNPIPLTPGLAPGPTTQPADPDRPPDWLWHGYLAPGQLTLLTGPAKAGKSTLAAVLLARLAAGGPLAGRPLRPGRALVLSDESATLWADRHARLNFGPHVRLVCQPFRTRPTADHWHGVADQLLWRRANGGLDLLVVDPLAAFLPARSKGRPPVFADLLPPLRRLTAAGLAVLLVHQPAKGGSPAPAAAADVHVDLTRFARAPADDRRRRLTAVSRNPETPARLAVELTPDGTDYVALGDFLAGADFVGWRVVTGLLAGTTEPLTRQQLLARWPATERRPHGVTVWKWLDAAAAVGRVVRRGTGRRNNPYRYRLPPAQGE